MALPIEDYALLGDMETAVLVGRDGSIDWLCLPRFDSPACFAALLGNQDNGRWLLGPKDPAKTTRSYFGDSFVLETTHETRGQTWSCCAGRVCRMPSAPVTRMSLTSLQVSG